MRGANWYWPISLGVATGEMLFDVGALYRDQSQNPLKAISRPRDGHRNCDRTKKHEDRRENGAVQQASGYGSRKHVVARSA
jgi:hypothetical protein